MKNHISFPKRITGRITSLLIVLGLLVFGLVLGTTLAWAQSPGGVIRACLKDSKVVSIGLADQLTCATCTELRCRHPVASPGAHDAPHARIAEARKVLKAGGTLVLAVPNLNDHLLRLAYRLVKGRKLRRFSLRDKEIHLFHFSVNSIRRLLDAAGFECRQIGPDFGILELSHRLVNGTAAAFFYLLGVHWYNSIQAVAGPK